MGFLAPLMLAGVLGLAIPVVVHLIGRQRARRVDFAAIHFLLGSDEKLARQLKLKEHLLLAVRVLCCVALALALAKPYTSCKQVGPPVLSGTQAIAIVLDDSILSRYVSDGESSFERAQRSALSILKRLPPDAQVALVFSTSPQNDVPASVEHERVAEKIRSGLPTHRTPNLPDALERAAAELSASLLVKKSVYLIAPMVRGSHPDPTWNWDERGGALHVADLSPPEFRNASIESASYRNDPDTGGIRVTATVRNDGQTAIARTITVQIGDETVATASIDVPGKQKTTKEFSVHVPPHMGRAAVTLALDGDSIEADNRRYLLLGHRTDVPVLLVNGSPSAAKQDDELFYLRTALRPGDREDSRVSFVETTPDRLGDIQLNDFEVVALVNVAKLSSSDAARIAAWVKSGGGLFVALGDQVDAEAYNQTMTALLPQPLQSPLYLAQGTGTPSGSVHLAKLRLDHPVLNVFSEKAPGLLKASFNVIYLLGPTAHRDRRETIANYDNGAVALATRDVANGRVLLFTSTLDRDWNDLAIHPGYLPLVQQSVLFLAGRNLRDLKTKTPGQRVDIPLRRNDREIVVSGPRGAAIYHRGSPTRRQDGALFKHG